MSIRYRFVCYRFIGAVTVSPNVSGCGILLDASFWSNGPWFLVAVAWKHSVWVMVMGVGMLGLILVSVG